MNKFPCVIVSDTKYVEIACPVPECNRNATNSGEFFKGIAGLTSHISNGHKGAEVRASQYGTEHFIVHTFDDEDCLRISNRQLPVSRTPVEIVKAVSVAPNQKGANPSEARKALASGEVTASTAPSPRSPHETAPVLSRSLSRAPIGASVVKNKAESQAHQPPSPKHRTNLPRIVEISDNSEEDGELVAKIRVTTPPITNRREQNAPTPSSTAKKDKPWGSESLQTTPESKAKAPQKVTTSGFTTASGWLSPAARRDKASRYFDTKTPRASHTGPTDPKRPAAPSSLAAPLQTPKNSSASKPKEPSTGQTPNNSSASKPKDPSTEHTLHGKNGLRYRQADNKSLSGEGSTERNPNGNGLAPRESGSAQPSQASRPGTSMRRIGSRANGPSQSLHTPAASRRPSQTPPQTARRARGARSASTEPDRPNGYPLESR